MCAVNLPKMQRGQNNRFKELTLDKWVNESLKNKQQVVIEDKNDIVVAFHSIVKRHSDLKGKQELVEKKAANVKAVFTEANLQINYLQLATSALAFLNHYKYPG